MLSSCCLVDVDLDFFFVFDLLVFGKPFGGFVGLSEPYGSIGGCLLFVMKN